MKYLALIGTTGPQPPDALAVMQRDLPGWIDEMNGSGRRLLGRELDFPDTSVTVRVRGGKVLTTDGPFAETKEFVAGFDLLDCADDLQAARVAGSSPVARFCPFDVRAFRGEMELGPGTAAFGSGDDSAGRPYLLMAWADAPITPRLAEECATWRDRLSSEGSLVLGGLLEDPATALAIRDRDGATELGNGSFLGLDEFIAGIEVVRAADRGQAAALAASHPLAAEEAIEVRAFYKAE